MGVNVQWHNPEHDILLLTFTSPWTIEEYLPVLDEFVVMAQNVPHTVYRIADFTRGQTQPHALLSTFKPIERAYQRAPNLGQAVLVKPGAFMTVALRIAGAITPEAASKIMTANTLLEAEEKIAQMRAQQP